LTEIAIAAKRYWNYPENWIQVWLPVLTVTPEYIAECETWLAVDKEAPIAFYSLKRDGIGEWLDNLWVSPDYIGKGVGKLLFHHAVDACRARGIKSLFIEADPNATGFYQKMGAHIVRENISAVGDQTRILPVLEINL
jgi:GNAT superfamily N-acetyltransferase